LFHPWREGDEPSSNDFPRLARRYATQTRLRLQASARLSGSVLHSEECQMLEQKLRSSEDHTIYSLEND